MNASAATAEAAAPRLLPRRASALRAALRRPRTIAGLCLAGGMLLIAIVGPLFAPHDPNQIIGPPFQSPTSGAPLGTDILGRDVLSRVLCGGLGVVWMAVTATVLGMVGGIAVGLFAGYLRTWPAAALMRGMDLLQAFPQIVLVLLFVSLLGPQLWLIVLLVGVAWIPQVGRVTQGITREVSERDFVRAQEIIGTPTRVILVTEILPNLASPLLVECAVRLAWSITAIAALSFLGFGVAPPAADWGRMINENQSGIAIQPWSMTPILCIGILTLGITLVAEALSLELAGETKRKRKK